MANIPTQLNNPGDLKDPATGQFRQFASPQEGFQALKNDLSAKMTGNTSTGLGPNSTLLDFAKVYAPASDKNDPLQYAKNIASKIGAGISDKISNFKLDEFAGAVAHAEGYVAPSAGSQMSVHDFAAKIKQKYPAYQNVDDQTLVQKIIAKYPTYKTQVDASGLPDSSQSYNPKPFSSGGQFSFNTTGTPNANSPAPQDQGLGAQLSGRMGQAGQALSDAGSGKINPVSGILQAVGAGAGAIGDVVGAGIGLIPGAKQAESAVGGAVAQIPGVQQGVQAYQGWAQQHPEMAGDLGAVGNIVQAVPVLKGAGLVARSVGKAISKDVLSNVVSDIMPNLTGKAAAKSAGQGGLVKSGILGTVSRVPTTAETNIAKAVAENVPGFDKLATFTDKVNATRGAIAKLATDLKSGVIASGKDRIYPFKELASRISGLVPPTSIYSDSGLENVYGRLKTAALQIAKKNGGNVSSLLDTRQEFDQLLNKEFPNLYSSDRMTPLRVGVKDIRDAITNFTEEKLPPGFGLKEKLQVQSKLFDAVDGMSAKAAKEEGGNAVGRAAARHPYIAKTVGTLAKYGAIATGLHELIP